MNDKTEVQPLTGEDAIALRGASLIFGVEHLADKCNAIASGDHVVISAADLKARDADLRAYKQGFEDAMREKESLRHDAERYRQLLLEAAQNIADWGAYASEYFQQKHDLDGCVQGYRDAAMQGDKS